MAKNLNEKANVSVILNSEQAERTLDSMTEKVKRLKVALKAAEKAGDSSKAKQLDKEISKLKKDINYLSKETKNYQDVLKSLDTASIRQLQAATRTLRNELKQLSPATKEFVEKSKQLKQVEARLNSLKGAASSTSSVLSRMTNTFNKYFGMITAGLASITGLSLGLRKAAEQAAQMDDIYSDVMKTTGLTRDEVVELNKEFRKMDTRTSREALNNLARDAGKLGISAKDDVLQFVRAADQINVALGEDLGEGAIRNIGKIADVFGLTKQMGIEKSFLSIGSAINALGQASTASESYLVDFTQRLAGVGAQTGLTVQNILGFASGLDQSAMKVEMAATAFQTFVMNMYKDTEAFAKYAGMSVKEFSDLMEKDANTAIITVLKSLNSKGGFKELVPMFKDMGAEGARAVSVLSSIATNIDAVTTAQQLSNEEFQKATSLTDEFSVKNNNRMAQMEKARKAFRDTVIEFGETLSPVMLKTTNLTTIAIKFLAEHHKAILVITSALVASATAWAVYHSWLKITQVATATWTVVTKAAAVAVNLLQGHTVAAMRAWIALKGAMSASVIGVVTVAVTALVTAIVKLTAKAREARRMMSDFFAEAAKLKREAGGLLDIMQQNGKQTDLYRQALTKLKETYGPYLTNLIDEKGELTDIAAARERINSAIEQEVALKMQAEAVNKIQEDSLKKQGDAYAKLMNTFSGRNGSEAGKILADKAVAGVRAGSSVESILSGMGIRDAGKYDTTGIPDQYYTNLYRNIEKFKKAYEEGINEIAAVKQRFSVFITQPVTTASSSSANVSSAATSVPGATADITDKEMKKIVDGIEMEQKAAENAITKLYLKGKMVKEAYDFQMENLHIEYLARINQAYIDAGKDNSEAEEKYLNALLEQKDKIRKDFEKALASVKITDDDLYPEVSLPEEEFPDVDKYKQLLEKAAALKNDVSMQSAGEIRDRELEELEELHDKQLISEEEYQKKRRKIQMKYAQSITEQFSNYVNQMANFVSSLEQLEYQRLEAEKQQQLTLYGDSADKRAEIENDYEKKKLEVQKKYADINMGIQIAQAISSTALAMIQAWNAAGGQPVLAAIIMAMIGATSAVQIASIVAQRNAIANMSVDSGNTQKRTLTSGYYDGGDTDESSDDHKVVGVVHANEWVAPAAMKRRYPTLFRTLESMRKDMGYGTSSGEFFQGGNTSASSSSGSSDAAVLRQLIQVLGKLSKDSIKAHVVLTEIHKEEERYNRFRKEGSR